MSRTVLGIDAGQTATHALLARTDGTIVARGVGGPVRHHADPEAGATGRSAMEGVLETALPGSEVADLVCLASTGSVGLLRADLEWHPRIRQVVTLESDAYAALASGAGAHGGIAVISGTGSVALARGRCAGRRVLLGGWGWLMGDQGSGFAIGLAALRAAAQGVDGTSAHTSLSVRVPEALGEADLRSVYDRVTGLATPRKLIGRLAEVAAQEASRGDRVAMGILMDAGRDLVDLATATARSAPFLDQSERLIVPTGGAFRSTIVHDTFTSGISATLPEFRLQEPLGPPVLGSVVLGIAELGVRVDATLMTTLATQLASLGGLHAKSSHHTTAKGDTT